MKIFVPKETQDRRVAIVPATVKKLIDLGVKVVIEANAGATAYFSDSLYREAGAEISSESSIPEGVTLIISVIPPVLDRIPKGTWLISNFQPFNHPNVKTDLHTAQLHAFSLDMIPRTTRAQSMDVLSSMASIAGYQAVLTAAKLLPRYFPMTITAAGTAKPAKVLVLGAGVAGLQAIAVARRLGGAVEAFDTRSAAKEEVQSLGAKFVEIAGAKEDTDAGGYAVAQSEDFLKKQREEVQKRAIKADVIITTAQVRGRKAPVLIPEDTVKAMSPGSVIIDLASSTGGNCALSKDNETVLIKGVTIIGNSVLAAEMPQDASIFFSNNVFNFLKIMIKDSAFIPDFDDEIIRASCI